MRAAAAEAPQRGQAGEGGDHRQPEVHHAVDEHGQHGRGERDPDPAQREREQRVDDAGAAERSVRRVSAYPVA